jgi:hypothetical protein
MQRAAIGLRTYTAPLVCMLPVVHSATWIPDRRPADLHALPTRTLYFAPTYTAIGGARRVQHKTP